MKYYFLIMFAFFAIVSGACSTTRYRMKNCDEVGRDGSERLYDCDQYRAPSTYTGKGISK